MKKLIPIPSHPIPSLSFPFRQFIPSHSIHPSLNQLPPM